MTDLISEPQNIEIENKRFRSATTESLIQEYGKFINWLLDNVIPRGVGSIMSSKNTEAEFQAEKGAGWVLMDGRSVVGSSYESVTGNSSIPDARGRYLRGKNGTRSDGFENPDGDVALGTFQSDQNGEHRHIDFITGVTDATLNTARDGGTVGRDATTPPEKFAIASVVASFTAVTDRGMYVLGADLTRFNSRADRVRGQGSQTALLNAGWQTLAIEPLSGATGFPNPVSSTFNTIRHTETRPITMITNFFIRIN